jgi:hypothetical protein
MRRYHRYFKCLLTGALLSSGFALLEAAAMTSLNANNDHQFWFEQNLAKELPCDWLMTLTTKQRWGADYRIFFYQEYECVLQRDITRLFCLRPNSVFEGFTLGPGIHFDQIFRRNTLGKFQHVWVYRTILEANVVMQVDKSLIRQRLRGEYLYHLKSHFKNFGRFRYRVRIDSPWIWTRYNINPYIFNEWFFRNNTYRSCNPTGLVGGYYENRFRVGVSTEIIKSTSTEFFWQWRRNKQSPGSSPRWDNIYIIGIVLNI